MEIPDLLQEVPRHPVGQLLTFKEHPKIALVDLGRDASVALRESMDISRPPDSGGAIDGAWILPTLGVGSTAASSLLAGNIFLATANPATLMTIGAGVGSAVVGPAGIVAQAPFVAASAALTPVLVPVMLFTTVSSVMICARLDRVQRTLGRLFEAVEVVRRLLDAEDYARLESAAEQIDEIRSEFEHVRQFSDDVKFKLAVVAKDVKVLKKKFECLLAKVVESDAEARLLVSHLNRFFLASLLDIQVDLLRLYLGLQDAPATVEFRHARLREKVERYGNDFRQILDDDPVGAFHRRLKGEMAKSRWRRRVSARLRLPFRNKLGKQIRNVRAVRNDSNSVRARIRGWTYAFDSATDESRKQTIVIYRKSDDERTIHAYHTRDLQLRQAVA